MVRAATLTLALVCAAGAQTRTITFREAIQIALEQNPDLAIARLEEQKARQGVRLAKDPFVPKVVAGSGLAFSNGFPLSIEGSAPSIFQAQASQSLFDRRQTHLVAQARENANGAAIDTAAKREEVALRAAALFLEAEKAGRLEESARRQVESLERAADLERLRVDEGRDLPIEAKKSELGVAKARQRLRMLEAEREAAERTLAAVLGLDENVRIRATAGERKPAALPPSEEAAASAAMENSKEIRRLESAILAKRFEIKSERAGRLPKVELVAQYALLARFNNYEDFFRTFQRHNGQLGVAFQVPVFSGPAVSALTAQAEGEAARLRLELQAARSRVANDARRLYQEVRTAESGRDVARLDLDVAREQLSVLLAQMEEGRVSLKQVEEARVAEDEKWMTFLESNYGLEMARLNLLKRTGELLAALREQGG